MSSSSPSPLPSIEEDVQSQDLPINFLQIEIEKMKQTAGLLHYRLNTMRDALQQETFHLGNLSIQVLKSPYEKHVRQLLKELGCEEDGLTVGTFLKALNIYLVHNDLVDLNDLQIIMTPLLTSAFQKPVGLSKYPYALLLTALPKMFQ